MIKEILLFDQFALAEATTLKSQAIQKLGGFKSGIGAIGDLGQVIMTSMVIGAVEDILSENLRKDGLKMLEAANAMLLMSRYKCHFFPLSNIKNVEIPIPQIWNATLSEQDNSRSFIHNGDPMIVVRCEDDIALSIMWDKVETYFVTTLP